MNTHVSRLDSASSPTPQSHAATGNAATELLLAPLDADADKALSAALNSLGTPCESRDCHYALRDLTVDLQTTITLLKAELRPSLQERVKVALGHTGQTLAASLVQAEPLPRFFDQIDSLWLPDVLNMGLHCVFLPIVDASTKETVAFESFIRARRGPHADEIGAGQLLYAAQKLGLLHQLDECAREVAIESCSRFLGKRQSVFLNLLPNSVYDSRQTLEHTLEAADKAGLTPNQIVVEVVEAEHVDDWQELRRTLDTWRNAGIKVALDDLGAGLSSLECIAELCPDYVKVDMARVCSINCSPASAHALQALSALANRLGAQVIAEGIETQLQSRFCQDAGVNLLQGYLFARPAFPPTQIDLRVFERQALAA
jgi:EAL domain-containing protein (putative c-di-GMP-specific phosphodiesterase class I)